VAVVIPVKDRAAELDLCLAALDGLRVVVVDDGSASPAAVASVVAAHGATLVRRPRSGGPAAARNTGLAAVADAEFVAFLDSDCVAPPGWLARLGAHFADPVVGAVAPRVAPLPSGGPSLRAYALVRSPLDLGTREALVRPGSRVSYVPTAALVVRRSALAPFDERLRYGEDVDALWRLVDAGWQVRYDPAVEVVHAEPGTWPSYLRRRFHYGTSAGPLAVRHPGRLAPMVWQPWPAAVAALLLARRPVPAVAAGAVAATRLARRLAEAGAPPGMAPALTAQAVGATLRGLGRATTQLALPVALAAGLTGRRRLAVVAALVAGPALEQWWRLRPGIDPLRWTLASVADDVAYGAGVWRGAVRARTAEPLLPRRGATQ
jgi:mycofactocin system glycosyltransferase